MKKGIFLFLLSITFFALRPQAQGIHIGLKAGSVGSQFTGRAFTGNMQWGFSGGAFAELGLTGKWGFQGEMLYNQIKSETADDFEDLYQQGGIPSRTFTLNYLNIPILLNYRFLPILSLQLGPQFGVLLSSSDNITANGVDPFRKNSFSMAAGAQVNLMKIKIGARYTYGFTNLCNVSEINQVDSWKNQTLQFYVGLRIF